MTIVWSLNGEISYAKIIAYISEKWTEKEVLNFIDKTDELLINIQKGIIQGNISKFTSYRTFVLSKQTTLFFEIDNSNKTINLLLFWNNRDNPEKLKELLKENR